MKRASQYVENLRTLFAERSWPEPYRTKIVWGLWMAENNEHFHPKPKSSLDADVKALASLSKG